MKKKIEKMKKILLKKPPTKLSWSTSAKSDKNIFYSKRKNTKLPWPMSAKSDT